MNIAIPEYVERIIDRLENAGYETYIVGGCVRDSLEGIGTGKGARSAGKKAMSEPSNDWDMCTSALPDEIMSVLGSDMKLIPTGIAHGTITVAGSSQAESIELTTFRNDGDYSDGRHPDSVEFVRSITEDLARRDFTVNAMAYSPKRGLVDPFGGSDDLRAGILRCVGDPEKRFGEDGLRILRCLRFSAVKGYSIEPETGASVISCRGMLRSVAWERIDDELLKLLGGKKVGELIDKYREVFITLIPELEATVGYEQHSVYHNRDVWGHTLAALDDIPADMPQLRLIMLFHDIAKPVVGVIDSTGRGRFQRHPIVGAEMTEKILRRMKFPSKLIQRAKTLVLYHDARVPAERSEVRKLMSRVGEEAFRQILTIQHADGAGKYAEFMPETEERLRNVEKLIDSILEDGDCISLRQLAVNGRDLTAAGIPPGESVGRILDKLLELVMVDKVRNDKDSLLKAVEGELIDSEI